MSTAVLLVAAIGAGDYATGANVSFAVAYLIPVFLSATVGRFGSTVIAGVVALTWTSVEVVLRPSASTHLLVPVWNTVARFLVLWIVAALVFTLATKLAEERSVSRTDPLTRLANARAFREAADTELGRMRQTHRPLTVAYVDIDDFKAINDTHGHSAGDDVLASVASTMTRVLRSTDHLARVGGDEFALLLPETDLQSALVLHQLHTALQAAASGRTAVGVSIGAAAFTEAPSSGQQLAHAADVVMYKAKQHGKNMVWGEQVQPREAAATLVGM
jgi:diguanylate cyclase (GGDEF)-like protein